MKTFEVTVTVLTKTDEKNPFGNFVYTMEKVNELTVRGTTYKEVSDKVYENYKNLNKKIKIAVTNIDQKHLSGKCFYYEA